ncbi:class IIb bacteriocin, lactobin A/cerein 7B family [Glaciecola sp. SC05]
MKELNMTEVQDVNGGVVPFIVGVIAIDVGLIAAMGIAHMAMHKLR